MDAQVKEIIHAVLTDNSALCMDNDYERELAAELCAIALQKVVVLQLAALLGGKMEYDEGGQAIIHTNVCFNEEAANGKPLHDFLG